MSAKALAVTLGVLGLLALLGYGLIQKNEQAIAQGDPVPEVPLTTLADGEPASLGDYRGRWVLVNFWSSWCDPCRVESPELQRFYERHRKRGFEVVGVDLEDVRSDALAFVEEFELTYPQLRAADNEEVISAFGLVARPENVLIDPEGRIALIRRGSVDAEYLADNVEPLIAAGGAS